MTIYTTLGLVWSSSGGYASWHSYITKIYIHCRSYFTIRNCSIYFCSLTCLANSCIYLIQMEFLCHRRPSTCCSRRFVYCLEDSLHLYSAIGLWMYSVGIRKLADYRIHDAHRNSLKMLSYSHNYPCPKILCGLFANNVADGRSNEHFACHLGF